MDHTPDPRQTDVFAPPMVRRPDHATSHAAAATVRPILGTLRTAILALIVGAPDGLTDGELERLPVFSKYAPSTVRKRRSELLQLGYVRGFGVRNGMIVWILRT